MNWRLGIGSVDRDRHRGRRSEGRVHSGGPGAGRRSASGLRPPWEEGAFKLIALLCFDPATGV